MRGGGIKLMKRYCWILVAGLSVIAIGCRKPQPKFSHPATIKDIMDSMVAPSGDFMFGAVETISDEHGVHQIAPQDTTFTEDLAAVPPAYNEDNWEALRLRLMVLLEAPNLLVMPGRKVAPPDVTSQNPQIELQPWQIQKLIDDDRPSFISRAKRLQNAAQVALKAVDDKNTDELFQAEGTLDDACENCHLHYWYPNDKRAQQLYEQEQQEERQQSQQK